MDENWCEANTDLFPCNTNAITAVSLGLAAGGLSLIFVLFLMRKVSYVRTARFVGGSVSQEKISFERRLNRSDKKLYPRGSLLLPT